MKTQTLKVPNKLNELTLGQYQKFNKVISGEPDNDFLQRKTIEIFCNVDITEVGNYKYSSIAQVVGIINKMFEEKPRLIDRFNYNGREFGFIPKLDDITFGEFVDLDLLMGDWETMDKAMAILFREVTDSKGGKYIIEPYNSEKENDFKNMPLDVALGALFFLESLNTELTRHTKLYLQKETKRLTPRQRKALMRVMDGTQLFTQSAKPI
jgi:hypothetical protein